MQCIGVKLNLFKILLGSEFKISIVGMSEKELLHFLGVAIF